MHFLSCWIMFLRILLNIFGPRHLLNILLPIGSWLCGLLFLVYFALYLIRTSLHTLLANLTNIGNVLEGCFHTWPKYMSLCLFPCWNFKQEVTWQIEPNHNIKCAAHALDHFHKWPWVHSRWTPDHCWTKGTAPRFLSKQNFYLNNVLSVRKQNCGNAFQI